MKRMISIRLNESTLNQYKKFAEMNDMTLTQLIKLAVNAYIEKSQHK